MSGLTELTVFTAHLGDPGAPPIGELGSGVDGAITLRHVDEPYRAVLEDIVAGANKLEAFRIKAPVPGGEPGEITRDEIARDDPRLNHAIVAFMEEKYNLFLEPIPA